MSTRERMRSVVVSGLSPAWARLRWRIEHIAQEVVEADGARRSEEIRHVRDEVHDLRTHTDRLVGELHARQDDIDNKLRLMAAQLAAADARVAQLERPGVDLAADGAERAEARRLIDEVRVEHGRARSGLAAVAFYEERISRLEHRLVGSGPDDRS